MSAEPKPSYEELLAENAELRAENAALKEALVRVEAALAQAMARIAELEARLNQNSKNSSKPPSSDPPFAKPKSLRGKSGRRPGRPDGQPGVTLSQVEDAGLHGGARAVVVWRLRGGPGGGACGGRGPPSGVRSARAAAGGHRAPGGRPALRLRGGDLRCAPRRMSSAPVQYGPKARAACVSDARAVPVGEPYREGDGGPVRCGARGRHGGLGPWRHAREPWPRWVR